MFGYFLVSCELKMSLHAGEYKDEPTHAGEIRESLHMQKTYYITKKNKSKIITGIVLQAL